MSLFVRVNVSFYTHRKTLRLKARLGNDALWLPPRLWAYAAEHHPDGILAGYTAEELGSLLGYTGDAQAMLEAMLQASFLDPDPLRIHDWEEHNSYHVTFAERARKAAEARWQKRKEPKEKRHGEGKERRREERSNATSIPQASKPKQQCLLAADEPPPAPPLSFLEKLKANPAYRGIDVEREFHKLRAWCETRNFKPTERRLVNWLNKIDKPIHTPATETPNGKDFNSWNRK